jgi:hypothetical protein
MSTIVYILAVWLGGNLALAIVLLKVGLRTSGTRRSRSREVHLPAINPVARLRRASRKRRAGRAPLV